MRKIEKTEQRKLDMITSLLRPGAQTSLPVQDFTDATGTRRMGVGTNTRNGNIQSLSSEYAN